MRRGENLGNFPIWTKGEKGGRIARIYCTSTRALTPPTPPPPHSEPALNHTALLLAQFTWSLALHQFNSPSGL